MCVCVRVAITDGMLTIYTSAGAGGLLRRVRRAIQARMGMSTPASASNATAALAWRSAPPIASAAPSTTSAERAATPARAMQRGIVDCMLA